MCSWIIQFNVHIEQLQRSKEKSLLRPRSLYLYNFKRAFHDSYANAANIKKKYLSGDPFIFLYGNEAL